MANEYPKINSLFLRDMNSIIMPDSFTLPEFNFLKDCKWECSEKIDGTNIHFDITFKADKAESGETVISHEVAICGRTAAAIIPRHLHSKLEEIINRCDENGPLIHQAFASAIQKMVEHEQEQLAVSIYGEGYGMKIQKGGNYIKNGVDFILFDVRVGERWLDREGCESVAAALKIQAVPLMAYMTIPEAIDYVKNGFKSTIAENPDYDAEGLVLKTPHGLRLRNGQRIILKIKTCDFVKYKDKYGDGPVEQLPNPKYMPKQV